MLSTMRACVGGQGGGVLLPLDQMLSALLHASIFTVAQLQPCCGTIG